MRGVSNKHCLLTFFISSSLGLLHQENSRVKRYMCLTQKIWQLLKDYQVCNIGIHHGCEGGIENLSHGLPFSITMLAE